MSILGKIGGVVAMLSVCLCISTMSIFFVLESLGTTISEKSVESKQLTDRIELKEEEQPYRISYGYNNRVNKEDEPTQIFPEIGYRISLTDEQGKEYLIEEMSPQGTGRQRGSQSVRYRKDISYIPPGEYTIDIRATDGRNRVVKGVFYELESGTFNIMHLEIFMFGGIIVSLILLTLGTIAKKLAD